MTAQHRFVLGPNQYGKAEVHVVKITRDSERHQIEDLCVTSELKGDFESAYLDGNNEHIVPTDTQKNTVFGPRGHRLAGGFPASGGPTFHRYLRLGFRRALGG